MAAYPDARVGWLRLYAAYVAGVGVNALFPARIGDVVRLTMAHRAIKGVSSLGASPEFWLMLSVSQCTSRRSHPSAF